MFDGKSPAVSISRLRRNGVCLDEQNEGDDIRGVIILENFNQKKVNVRLARELIIYHSPALVRRMAT